MSYYSDSNVTTHYLDPSTYIPQSASNQGRVSFELDGTKLAFLPNMRLLNVGCDSTTIQIYNPLVGAYVVIDRIRLLDGDTELSALTNHQLYRGFLNQNTTNAQSESVNSKLSMNTVGWTVNGEDRQLNRVERVRGVGPTVQTLGYLDLREVFPILSSLNHLPTSVFKNLNIQITLTGLLADQILEDISAVVNGVRPILAVDVLENPKIVAQMRKSLDTARWLEIEHDRFLIPQSTLDGAAGDQGIVQAVNVKINGFNNKHVERLLIIKELVDPAPTLNGTVVRGFGRWASPSCFRQQLQYRLNGRNILPRNGIVGNNERLAYLVDTYGDCANYPGSNVYGLGPVGGGSAAHGIMLAANDYIGQLDYMGIYLGDYINDLQINYSREGLNDTDPLRPTTAAIHAHCYGEVAKILVIRSDNTYMVSYAQN